MNPKIGVVDVGGGYRGVYAAGVLDYCMHKGVWFDLGIGVSAGSIIFANNLPGHLGLLDAKLNVHCQTTSFVGTVRFPLKEPVIDLSNTAAILLESMPDDVEIVDSGY